MNAFCTKHKFILLIFLIGQRLGENDFILICIISRSILMTDGALVLIILLYLNVLFNHHFINFEDDKIRSGY